MQRRSHPGLTHAARLDPPGSKAQVRVVGAQQQPPLSTGSEHAVWLLRASRHQVVDQHAEVTLMPGASGTPLPWGGQRRAVAGVWSWERGQGAVSTSPRAGRPRRAERALPRGTRGPR